jgi:hypothetical protein
MRDRRIQKCVGFKVRGDESDSKTGERPQWSKGIRKRLVNFLRGEFNNWSSDQDRLRHHRERYEFRLKQRSLPAATAFAFVRMMLVAGRRGLHFERIHQTRSATLEVN